MQTDRPTVAEVTPLAQMIYDRHSSGCCLHVMLDDGNVSDGNAKFCVELATERGHQECLAVALLLRTMTRSQRGRVGKAMR
jgi:hypothetical protein